MAKRLETFFCRRCADKCNHILGPDYTSRMSEADDEALGSVHYRIVECRQCGEVSAVKTATPSATGEQTDAGAHGELLPLEHLPSPSLWFEDLSDEQLRRILSGLYQSLDKPDLTAFGVRMAVDRLMTLTLGEQECFEDGLKAWQDQNKISAGEMRILMPLTNIGQVSDRPNPIAGQEERSILLDTLEKLICRLFVLPAAGEKTTRNIRRNSGTIRLLKTPDGRIVDFSVGFGVHRGLNLAEEELHWAKTEAAAE